jgi:ribosome-associated protein
LPASDRAVALARAAAEAAAEKLADDIVAFDVSDQLVITDAFVLCSAPNGDIVVHVQHADDRQFYALERLWKDCPTILLPEVALVGRNGRHGGSSGAGM